MTIVNQAQLRNTRAKLKLLEERHAELKKGPADSAATRNLTLRSLEKWMKRLKEEILRYECQTSSKSEGR
jgi:hypothetical protein